DALDATPLFQYVECGYDERRGEPPVFTDDHHLRNHRRLHEFILQHLVCHIFATGGFKHFLFAVGDSQEPFGIQLADVAGMEVTLGVDDLGRGFFILVIATEYTRSLTQYFTIFGNFHINMFEYLPHGAEFDASFLQRIYGDHWRGLGKAIALHHGHARSPKYPGKAGLERSAHRNDQLDVTAQGFLPFLEHQFTGDTQLEIHPAAVLAGLLIVKPQVERPEENMLFQSLELLALRHDFIIDFFQYAWHCGEPMGLHVVDVGYDGIKALRVMYLHTLGEVQVYAHALEDVAQRQKAECLPVVIRQKIETVINVRQHVFMGKAYALRFAGGARCIDQRKEIVFTHGVSVWL